MTKNVSTVQKRGQVTIPASLREDLGLEPGDQVAFMRTERGILLTTPESQKVIRLRQLLDEMKSLVQETVEVEGKSYTFEELIESGREVRAEILTEKYGLDVKDD